MIAPQPNSEGRASRPAPPGNTASHLQSRQCPRSRQPRPAPPPRPSPARPPGHSDRRCTPIHVLHDHEARRAAIAGLTVDGFDQLRPGHAPATGERGGQTVYADIAIETEPALCLVLHQPLRQTEGSLRSTRGFGRLRACLWGSAILRQHQNQIEAAPVNFQRDLALMCSSSSSSPALSRTIAIASIRKDAQPLHLQLGGP